MERLLSLYTALETREEGQTMVEYALVLALMVVVIAAIFTASGITGEITGTLGDVVSSFTP